MSGEEVPTHAPARGATSIPNITQGGATSSNPRTRTGCDLATFVVLAAEGVPTHAPARGAT